MYLQSKYSDWYQALMMKARKRTELNEKHERHHVLPKSLGGTDHRTNIVQLTYREHFIAHALLARMTVGNAKWKMTAALNAMINDSRRLERYLPSSRLIASAKASFIEELSRRMKGRKLSTETRQKMSQAKLGMKPNAETRRKMSVAKQGVAQSAEAKEARSRSMLEHYQTISEADKERNSLAISRAKKGRSNGHEGMTYSAETRKKMSDARALYWAKKRSGL